MEGNFEKQWREAFEESSQEPPKIVWSEISSQLTAEKLAAVQKQKIYYQIGIAATLMITSFLGFSYYSSIQKMDSQVLSDNKLSTPGSLSIPIYTPSFTESETGSGSQGLIAEDESDEKIRSVGRKETEEEKWGKVINFELLTSELSPKSIELAVNYGEVKDHLYGVPKTYLVRNKSKTKEKFWAGVDVASSTFDPNFQGGDSDISNSLEVKNNQFSPTFLSNNSSVEANGPLVRENMTSGLSLGLGVNFGVELSERWYLQSGIQYSRTSATNTTNVVVETRQTVSPIPATSQYGRVAQVQDILNAEEVVSYEYQDVELENQFQFASIPLNAGFKVLDQKFSMGVSAGVTTNIYLGNKLTDPTDQLAEVTIGPGSSSPYRQVNFMGQTGVQFGYEIFEHFDLTVEPNYRHSINSLTKANADFVTNPSGLGLQTGIRYRFE